MPQGSWRHRRELWQRRRALALLFFRFVLIGGAGALLTLLLTELAEIAFGPEKVRAWIIKLYQQLPVIGASLETLTPEALNQRVATYYLSARLLIGWAISVLAGGALATRARDLFYRPYDDWSMRPIGRDHADFRGGSADSEILPWVRPARASLRVWNALHEAIAAGSGDGRRGVLRPFGRSDVPVPFGYVLLLGRPGSGKSRMAFQFARALGGRPRLGDGERGAKAGWRERAGIWARRRCWFLARRPADPWDTGLVDIRERLDLDPGEASDSAGLEVLDGWRPRAPTLLWLDDPTASEAARCISLLEGHAREGRYRHPVRLVVTNQTRLAFKPEVRPGLPRPLTTLVLPANSFGIAEIRLLAVPVLGERFARRLYRTADIESFLSVTEGNPLLVELGLQWLGSGRPLAEMTRHEIIEHRHRRIVAALAEAGVAMDEGDTLRALAAATLVGPGCPIAPLNQAFHNRVPLRETLERAFPLESAGGVDLSTLLPAIRPEVLGDHFVRWVIAAQTAEESARAIVGAGFRARPEGWIRAVGRLSAGADVLARALLEPPPIAPGDLELRSAVGEAWIRQGIRALTDPLAVVEKLAGLVAGHGKAAERRVLVRDLRSRLEREIAEDWDLRSSPRYVGDVEATDCEQWQGAEEAEPPLISGRELAVIGVGLIGLELSTVRAELSRSAALKMIEDFCRLLNAASMLDGFDLLPEQQSSASSVLRDLYAALTSALGPAEAARRIYVGLRAQPASGAKAPFYHALAGLRDEIEGNDVAFALAAQSWTELDDSASCERIVRRVEKIGSLPECLGDRDIQLARAAAWSNLAFALEKDAASAQIATSKVETLLGSGAARSDLELQRLRAQTWRFLAFARQDDPAGCRQALAQVESVVSDGEFPDDPDLWRERARVWRCLAFAERDDLESCRKAVAEVERFAAGPGFAADRFMQLERAEAWNYLVAVCDDDLSESRAAAARVETIATRPAFRADRDFQVQRAAAWSALAHAQSSDLYACKAAVAQVRAIADRPAYANDRNFLFQRTKGWSSLAAAFAQAADPVGCRNYVDKVEAIAARPDLASDRDVQRERASAWRYLAFSYRMDPEPCLEAVARVEEIAAAPMCSADPVQQLNRARAWTYLAAARIEDRAGCLEAVAKVEAILAPGTFAIDAQMRADLETARSYLDGGR